MALSISFKYEGYAVAGEPLSSFDLAHIEVSGRGGVVGTIDRHGSAMIFLSITDLLGHVRRLLSDKKYKQFRWVAGDCSFTVVFQKVGQNIVVSHNKQHIDTVTHQELAQAVFAAVNRTLETWDVASRLSPSEAIYHDLYNSLHAYQQFLTQCS